MLVRALQLVVDSVHHWLAQWAQDKTNNIKHVLFDCNAETPGRVLRQTTGITGGGKNFTKILRVLFPV